MSFTRETNKRTFDHSTDRARFEASFAYVGPDADDVDDEVNMTLPFDASSLNTGIQAAMHHLTTVVPNVLADLDNGPVEDKVAITRRLGSTMFGNQVTIELVVWVNGRAANTVRSEIVAAMDTVLRTAFVIVVRHGTNDDVRMSNLFAKAFGSLGSDPLVDLLGIAFGGIRRATRSAGPFANLPGGFRQS